jgi:uncharacterized membrane protein YeiB
MWEVFALLFGLGCGLMIGQRWEQLRREHVKGRGL